MTDRYELTGETREHLHHTLHRVRWLDTGREGGWIENAICVPQNGTARLYCDAMVLGNTARLYGGLFRGSEFHGGVFRQSPCCAQRSDGYMFVAKVVDGKPRIWVGCRDFSWPEAVAHWHDGHVHGAESQRIIHFLKMQAEAEAMRWKEGG